MEGENSLRAGTSRAPALAHTSPLFPSQQSPAAAAGGPPEGPGHQRTCFCFLCTRSVCPGWHCSHSLTLTPNNNAKPFLSRFTGPIADITHWICTIKWPALHAKSYSQQLTMSWSWTRSAYICTNAGTAVKSHSSNVPKGFLRAMQNTWGLTWLHAASVPSQSIQCSVTKYPVLSPYFLLSSGPNCDEQNQVLAGWRVGLERCMKKIKVWQFCI